ncbi:MAG: glycosyltransferase [Anaeroplasma sp.]
MVEFILNWLESNFNFNGIENIYRSITNIILYTFSFLLSYRTIYTLIGFFCKAKKFSSKEMKMTYACCIAARNEEKVIGKLIESIYKQTYLPSKVRIYVVADNCTDKTAEICRNLGAIVYERNDKKHVSKGFALQYLFECIDKDYGINSVDNYLFFDADNLLKPDFIEEINNAMETGFDVCTSFRNIKNFNTNIISAGYGIHFYRNTLIGHRPRSIFGTSTCVTGTGYAVKSTHLVNGWNHTNLTEDTEFSTISVSNNLSIGYCEAAEVYDEQPTNFKTMWKQRVRWARGRLINFKNNSPKLIKNLFKGNFWSKYDIFWQMFPYELMVFLLSIFVEIFGVIFSFVTTGSFNFFMIFKYLGGLLVGTYVGSIGIGILCLLKERKKLRCGIMKCIIYILLWPWFDLLSLPILIFAVFKRVKWDPIEHNDSRSIEDLN